MKVLGISGSLRRDSHNTELLRAAASQLPPGVEFELYEGLKDIPPYDEDEDKSQVGSVQRLKEHIAAADEHPYVTFDSTLIRAEGNTLVVEGELTIKGTTLPIVARGTIAEPHVTFGDLEKVGVELEAIVDRTQYGLNWKAPLPKGGFALGNDVTLSASLGLARA